MQRVALLNGNNINQDYDFSSFFEAISGNVNGGVITGLDIDTNNNQITAGKAFVKVSRGGKDFFILFELTENLDINTNGDGKIYIEVNQANIDDGNLNTAEGDNIAEIKKTTDYPTNNPYLALFEISGGNITDLREFVKLKNEVLKDLDANELNFDNLNKNITTSGKITAGSFEGNGSLLTGIIADVPYTKTQFTAGEDLQAGDAVYVYSSDGKVYKTNATDTTKIGFIGFAQSTVASGDTVNIATAGVNNHGNYKKSISNGEIRYIRDWVNGSTSNSSNHWVEIKVIEKGSGTNLAQGITATSNYNIDNISRITDGDTNSNNYADGSSNVLQYVEIDLGAEYELDKIQVWHYYNDGRTYHKTRIQISKDGENWLDVFNSAIEGEYEETSSGKEIIIEDEYSIIEVGKKMYLSDVDGKISSTPGTNIVYVGKSISETEIDIQKEYNEIIDLGGTAISYNTVYKAETDLIFGGNVTNRYSNKSTSMILNIGKTSDTLLVINKTPATNNQTTPTLYAFCPKGMYYKVTASYSGGYIQSSDLKKY